MEWKSKWKSKWKSERQVTVRRSPLFKRLFLRTVAVLLISFVLIGTALTLLISKYWMNEKTEQLKDNTLAVAANTRDVLASSYMGESSRGSIIMICNNLRQISNAIDADIFITNTAGDVVYCREILQSDMAIYTGACLVHDAYHISDDLMEQAVDVGFVGTGYLGGELSDYSLIASYPVKVNDTTIAVVFSTKPVWDGLAPYLLAIFKIFCASAFITFFIAFFVIYGFTARLTKPLREMSAATKQYANGDFSRRIVIDTGKKPNPDDDEISDLITAFNAMAQALATLEMSRRSFVANVSHELKTPMTTIGGFIDGILDGTIEGERRDQYLRVVSDEVKRLSRLVTGMLNMSKIESGEFNLKPTEFDISEMVITTLLSFEQIIENRRIDVRGLETMAPNPVLADKDLINQVVYNLIDNAVKFTPDEGYIEVTSKRDAEKIMVRVRNSGRGIDPEEIDKVFERFYKVDKSRSYDTKGAGMGLYIVKTIVEIHGGHIKAASIPNDHTDFVFWLPLM